MPATAFVFGNEIGQQIKDVSRAWETAVLKGHGYTPIYTTTKAVSPESRKLLATIDLAFHDLRREAGSRWLEGGVPLHTIRDWLGHTSIAQTSTYLSGTTIAQHDAMRRFEARRADVQQSATGSGKGGRKTTRPDKTASRKARKNAVQHEAH